MTHPHDTPSNTLLTSPQSLNSAASSQFAPPSLSSAIRPQLLIHKQEDDHVRSTSASHLTLLVDQRPTSIQRRGYNSEDFNSDSSAHSSFAPQQSQSYLSVSSPNHQTFFPSTRQRLYHIIDSVPVTLVVFVLMATDFCFFQTAYLYILQHSHSPLFNRIYSILDWVLVVVYLLEVNVRLYTYGPQFYFHGALRCLDYVIVSGNAICIVSYLIHPQPWLLLIRFVRTLRMVTALTTWRERKLKGRTREQLQSLAYLLEKEKSEHSKLTKWKIDPDSIAIGEKAGQGGFGTVFSGLFRGTLVAVKKVSYPDQKQAVSSIEDEAITLVNLRHPNVVLFMGFLHEPSQLWIVTEYCSRGSLRDILDDTNLTLTEGRLLKLALGAARGLAYLHGQDPPVLHLDLKTSNVLISSGWDAKLGDFGLSRSIDNIEKDWFSGTMQYAAPEILESNVFSTAADIYSFGICLWEMAAREVPYQGLSPMAVLWGVVKSKLRPSLDSIKVAINDSKMNVKKGESCSNTHLVSESESQIKHQKSTQNSIHTSSDRKDPTEFKSRTAITTKETVISLEEEKSPAHNTNTYSKPEIKIFERVEVDDKTCGVSKEPVATNIVEGIVLPSAKNPTDRTSFQAVQKGKEDIEPSSLSQPRKRRSAFREQNRPAQTESHEGRLSGLTHKVTQTIQMFDERPPVIRKKEQEGSQENAIQSRQESVTGSVSGGLSVRTKRNGNERSVLRVPRQLPHLRSTKKKRVSSSRTELGSTMDETEPFLRRLASVSHRTTQNSASGGNVIMPGGREGEECTATSMKSVDNERVDGNPSLAVSQAMVPKEYVDLIQKCWSHDPKDRPSAGEIVWRLVILIDGRMREKGKSGKKPEGSG